MHRLPFVQCYLRRVHQSSDGIYEFKWCPWRGTFNGYVDHIINQHNGAHLPRSQIARETGHTHVSKRVHISIMIYQYRSRAWRPKMMAHLMMIIVY
jgi:hypothetical protein